jgi:Leucine-rich repeat (LRR) protein
MCEMTMISKTTNIIAGILCSYLVCGCSHYSVSVNDKLVYTPPPVFKDYQIEDQLLKACVEQTIYDLHITQAEDLKQLNCSHAGIKSLRGLSKFFALEALNLADNHLVDIAELKNLGRLKQLVLTQNAITDATPLLSLLHLHSLNLEDNPGLACADLKQLEQNQASTKLELQLPRQCLN